MVNILKKQGNHKSKPKSTFIKNENKILKQKINGNHPTKKKKKIERNIVNWKTRFKMATNTYLSIITFNVNGLYVPIKTRRVADWIKMQKPSILCL